MSIFTFRISGVSENGDELRRAGVLGPSSILKQGEIQQISSWFASKNPKQE
jgi:hypothetical protein